MGTLRIWIWLALIGVIVCAVTAVLQPQSVVLVGFYVLAIVWTAALVRPTWLPNRHAHDWEDAGKGTLI